MLRLVVYCSGSGMGSIIEPLPAVALNDELQQARASVAKAEADVLFKITKKVPPILYCHLFLFLLVIIFCNGFLTKSLSIFFFLWTVDARRSS